MSNAGAMWKASTAEKRNAQTAVRSARLTIRGEVSDLPLEEASAMRRRTAGLGADWDVVVRLTGLKGWCETRGRARKIGGLRMARDCVACVAGESSEGDDGLAVAVVRPKKGVQAWQVAGWRACRAEARPHPIRAVVPSCRRRVEHRRACRVALRLLERVVRRRAGGFAALPM